MKIMRVDINEEVMRECGAAAAIIFSHISFWVDFNKRNKQTKKEGAYWTHQTYEEISDAFHKSLTTKQVITTVKNLKEAGIINVGFFSPYPKQNTPWYNLTDKGKKCSPKYDYRGGKVSIRDTESPLLNIDPESQSDMTGWSEQSDKKGRASQPKKAELVCQICQSIIGNRKNTIIEQTEGAPPPPSAQIDQIIHSFAQLRVGKTTHYAMATQRDSAAELINTVGYEMAMQYASDGVKATLARINGDKYAPMIASPLDLKEKLIKLLNWTQKPIQEQKNLGSWRAILDK